MSRYGGYGRYGRWSFFPPKPTVAERKAKAEKMRKRLAADGHPLSPVVLPGRTIAKTFWGKAWCDNIESYRDFAYRLERGRSYVRSGAVLDLAVSQGRIDALVAGSGTEPYRVALRIDPTDPAKWAALVQRSIGRISSLLALTQGKLPEDLLRDFCNRETGLFPAPGEMHLSCSCPDVAGCCKHVAAVLYGVGARLDNAPELFFALRSIDPKDLVAQGAVAEITRDAESEIAGGDLADVFGIALDDDGTGPALPAEPPPPPPPAPVKRKPGRPQKSKTPAPKPKKAPPKPQKTPKKQKKSPKKAPSPSPPSHNSHPSHKSHKSHPPFSTPSPP